MIDGVPRLDRDSFVIAVRDARERRHRLALASRAEHEQLLAGQLRRLVGIHDRVLRERDVAEIARDVEVLPHRAPDDDDLPAALDADVGRLLHAVDVRRERGDQDLPALQREDRAECLADEPLGAGVSGPLGVRRVAEQEVDPTVADLCELSDIGLEPVDRRVVELPVPGVDDPTGGRLDDERRRIRNGVRHADELDAERAEVERLVTRRGRDELRLLSETMLVELRLHERERQRGRDDRFDVDLAQEVRQASDVILVAVREHDRPHVPSLEVRDVRQKEVDAEVLVARERKPGVDDDDLVVELVDGHVLPDLAESAERDDPERVCHSD